MGFSRPTKRNAKAAGYWLLVVFVAGTRSPDRRRYGFLLFIFFGLGRVQMNSGSGVKRKQGQLFVL